MGRGRGRGTLAKGAGAGDGASDGAGEREEAVDRGRLLGPAPEVSAGSVVVLVVFFGTWDLVVEEEGADTELVAAGAFFLDFFVALVVGGGADALAGGAEWLS